MKDLSIRIKEKRGNKGLREAAREIGISSATLSRIESGKQPDIQTFSKICTWLGVDPNSILGFEPETSPEPAYSTSLPLVHFRAEKTMSAKTVQKLAELIMAVQQNMPK